MELDTWNVFSSRDLRDSFVVERRLVDVAIGVNKANQWEPTSRHAPDLFPSRQCLGVSSGPRRRPWPSSCREPLAEFGVAVLMIDGFEVARSRLKPTPG
jgi:hypothetical protein